MHSRASLSRQQRSRADAGASSNSRPADKTSDSRPTDYASQRATMPSAVGPKEQQDVSRDVLYLVRSAPDLLGLLGQPHKQGSGVKEEDSLNTCSEDDNEMTPFERHPLARKPLASTSSRPTDFPTQHLHSSQSHANISVPHSNSQSHLNQQETVPPSKSFPRLNQDACLSPEGSGVQGSGVQSQGAQADARTSRLRLMMRLGLGPSDRKDKLDLRVPSRGDNSRPVPTRRSAAPLSNIFGGAGDNSRNSDLDNSLNQTVSSDDPSMLVVESPSESQMEAMGNEFDKEYRRKHPKNEARTGAGGREVRSRVNSGEAEDLGPNNNKQSDLLEFRLNLVDLRSREDFRINYLRKLSYANVWIPQARRPPQHQTISIFDWDDTLLCTSYINLRGDEAASTITQQLSAIEFHAMNLLATAMKLGRVFVITNAMFGWVEFSARKYLPGLLRTLQNITIISARHRFEGEYPGDYHRWKIQAFLEVQKTLNAQIITNLVSVGDSNIEMDAVHVMGQEFSQALVKTIKFRENPSPDELAKQLELVSQKFEKICLNARNLKIGLERRVVKPIDRNAQGKPSQTSTAVSHPSDGSKEDERKKKSMSSSGMGLIGTAGKQSPQQILIQKQFEYAQQMPQQTSYGNDFRGK